MLNIYGQLGSNILKDLDRKRGCPSIVCESFVLIFLAGHSSILLTMEQKQISAAIFNQGNTTWPVNLLFYSPPPTPPSLQSLTSKRENVTPDYPLTLLEGLTTIGHFCLLDHPNQTKKVSAQHQPLA